MISERMDVLAIHASVQAAKAGENGKGFNVIAEGVQDISALFGEHSKRIKALVDTTYSNIKATTQTIKMAGDEIDEGTRLTTIVDNSLANLNDQSTYLSESVKRIDEKRVKQKERYDNSPIFYKMFLNRMMKYLKIIKKLLQNQLPLEKKRLVYKKS